MRVKPEKADFEPRKKEETSTKSQRFLPKYRVLPCGITHSIIEV